MNWVKFERSDMLRDRADTPEVSIWKKGTIAFTKAAEEKYGIKQYRYASPTSIQTPGRSASSSRTTGAGRRMFLR